jgi:hypothetical protein
MNLFSRSCVKRAARQAINSPEKAGLGWLIAGVILILSVILFLLGQQ